MINVKEIERIIMQPWDSYKRITLNKETQRYLETFLENHYKFVRKGLLDLSVDENVRKQMYSELLDTMGEDKFLLVCHISNCIKGISDAENVYINDVFKLQDCICEREE